MEFMYLIFYVCLTLRVLDVETNPSPQHPVPAVCRILCSNVQGLAGNLSDLTVASSQYDILFCSETLVSDMRHVVAHATWHRPSRHTREQLQLLFALLAAFSC